MSVANHRTGFLFVTASAVAWSLGGLFTRLIHVDNWTMSAWRGLFGALGLAVVMPFLVPRREMWSGLRTMRWQGWAFVIQSAAGMICYLAALRHTSVANVAVIYATAPFLAAGLAWLMLREKPGASSVIASLAALAGVALMVGFGEKGGLLGDLLALGMTLMMACAAVVARSFRDIPILLTTSLSSLISGLVSWPLGSPMAVSASDLIWLALFGICNFAIALPLYSFGARHLPAIETALIGAVDAPLAPLWVWLFFNEVPGASTLWGGAIVFCAVMTHVAVNELGKGQRATPAHECTQPTEP
jgi:drug/metabolite transporter (DMT)-like permease